MASASKCTHGPARKVSLSERSAVTNLWKQQACRRSPASKSARVLVTERADRALRDQFGWPIATCGDNGDGNLTLATYLEIRCCSVSCDGPLRMRWSAEKQHASSRERKLPNGHAAAKRVLQLATQCNPQRESWVNWHANRIIRANDLRVCPLRARLCVKIAPFQAVHCIPPCYSYVLQQLQSVTRTDSNQRGIQQVAAAVRTICLR